MKLNSNSWHYKLVDKFYRTESYSLCSHFWRVVFAMIAMVFLALLMVALLTIIAVGCYKGITEHPIHFLILMGSSIGFTACIVGGCLLYEWRQNHLGGEPKTLLGKWWKAKKEKVCPVIEWTYEE